MDFIKVARFNSRQQVSQLSLHLQQQGIEHKIIEEDNADYLYVDARRAEGVEQWLRKVQSGQAGTQFDGGAVKKTFSALPVTCGSMLLGLLGYLLVRFDHQREWVTHLTFTHFENPLQYYFSFNFVDKFEIWRLLTPTFLHFSFMHVLFNGLWIWELGRRLELYQGRVLHFFTFLSIAIFSNCVQYIASGPVIFGGLSGVVFGYLGLVGVLYFRQPTALFFLPKPLYVLAGISLLAGVFGLLEPFGIQIANGAHIGGLVAGLVFGAVVPLKMNDKA